MTPKFSPTRSAELLALAEAPITGGYDMEELCECGSDYGDHSGLECPQGETQFRPARHALATELRIAVEVIGKMRDALNAALVMQDSGPKPKKLDEALSWRENDDKARSMIDEALSLIGE